MEVGIRELRDGLSRHIAEVRSGHVLTVTEHGQPVAQIIPMKGMSRLDVLRSEGLVRQAKKAKRPSPKPISAKGTVSDLIDDQRR